MKWIPISAILPEYMQLVLIRDSQGERWIGRFDPTEVQFKTRFYIDSLSQWSSTNYLHAERGPFRLKNLPLVMHWMPLP